MEPQANNNNFNADELEAPEWLNAQFFGEVLSKHEKSPELKVLDVKISPASAKGDHYASVMFRSNVSYTTEKGNGSKSLIIKTMPEAEGHKKEMLGESNIFETEIGMYTEILPKFEQILREAGDNTRLCVPCLYHSLEPRQVMIFEDLVPQGYTVVRNRDATDEELRAAYSKLAKLHAISYKILKETPEYLKEFKHGLFDMPNLMDDPFMTSGMRIFIEFLDKTPELTKYKPYFEQIQNDYLERVKVVMQEYRTNPQPNGYYVLIHGDFHLRNMMFKHNPSDGNLEDVMLLDFQISNVGPITLDLIYSIYMLLGCNHRRNFHKELINFYFSEFVETLQKIGFKGELPNSVEFWKQMCNHKAFDIFLLTSFLPMMTGLKKNTFDPAEILQNEDVRKELYLLDEYAEDAKHLLLRFENEGYLD